MKCSEEMTLKDSFMSLIEHFEVFKTVLAWLHVSSYWGLILVTSMNPAVKSARSDCSARGGGLPSLPWSAAESLLCAPPSAGKTLVNPVFTRVLNCPQPLRAETFQHRLYVYERQNALCLLTAVCFSLSSPQRRGGEDRDVYRHWQHDRHDAHGTEGGCLWRCEPNTRAALSAHPDRCKRWPLPTPPAPRTDSWTRSLQSRHKQAEGAEKGNRACDAKAEAESLTKLNFSLLFGASSPSDAVLLHLPGSAGVLPVRRHRAGCVLSGGPSAQASQHQGSPRQAGPGGGVQGRKKGANPP